ncbi:MAG TPA: TonB-dependent receptor [Chitinophagaceae bacterium]
MRKLTLLLPALLFGAVVLAQNGKDTTRAKTDSIVNEIKDDINETIPTVSIDDDFDGGGQGVASLLTAGRDPFYNAASFNFNAVRFRIRGYDNDLNATFMNGIPMDNLDNGFTPFGLWGGLNDVMRNRDLSISLRPNTFAFGDIGSSTYIDARASRQRAQTQFGYALSNRNYTHRFTFYHGTGVSKKGWAFTFAGSRRWAEEGYVPGTYYDGWSYFAAADKRLNSKHLLSLIAFGAPTENGRQTGSVQEAMDLAGTNYYNPAWGWQNGKKRNSNVAKSHQPYVILNHEFRMNNNTSLVTAAGYSFGDRATTALDWYNSADPRPDYYRYLPSYELDPMWQEQMRNTIIANPDLLQINWARLYEANRANGDSVVAGKVIPGSRSHYIIQDRVINTSRLNLNSVFNTRFGNNVDFTAGASYQLQKNNYFNRVNDLLGGDYFVDLNQFGERDFPTNPNAGQNDLNNPNRILAKGDKYGHNYDINITRAAGWAQGVFKFNKVDFFLSAELSQTRFWRVGKVRNGLYPDNSFGKSAVNDFLNYAVKGGVTYKINGRNYLYVNGAILTRAPYFDNVYLAPRTRDFIQDNTTSEKIQSVEGGYVLNSPNIKARVTGYYTKFEDQMNVMTFYHDDVRNFVNYAMSNIDKVHYGAEVGLEAKLTTTVTANVAAAMGEYYFDSRQNAQVTVDNNSTQLDVTRAKQTIYSEGYVVPGTPQQAYSLGFTYRSPNYWFVSLTGSYMEQMWLDFNPIRRTQAAVDGLDLNKADELARYHSIIDQQRLDAQFTMDFFGGYSWKLPGRYGLGRNTFVVFNAGINNLLNNKDIVSGGFEQLRYDFATANVDKFAPKLYYSYGLNYFISVAFRFQK